MDLKTYLGCAGYEVTDEDSTEIAHNLGSYCANQDGAVHLGFFQDATCPNETFYVGRRSPSIGRNKF